MKILVARLKHFYDGREIDTYAGSIVRELIAAGHEVTEVNKDRLPDNEYKQYDLLVDIDCGRDTDQSYKFHIMDKSVPVKTAAILIDSHGKPEEHLTLSRYADHVFFAVWDRRDLFTGHPSATWFPNFTDFKHFDKETVGKKYEVSPKFDFCFFGSKGGLDRADKLVELCKALNYSYDVDEVGRKGKHRWPNTAIRMAGCKFGFNHGQKHDGPNLRVMETMAMGLPLITDTDPRSGMGYLFEPWQHYIPYEAYTYTDLDKRLKWCVENPDKAAKIAQNAYDEIKLNHLVEHRVKTLLEVVCQKS